MVAVRVEARSSACWASSEARWVVIGFFGFFVVCLGEEEGEGEGDGFGRGAGVGVVGMRTWEFDKPQKWSFSSSSLQSSGLEDAVLRSEGSASGVWICCPGSLCARLSMLSI